MERKDEKVIKLDVKKQINTTYLEIIRNFEERRVRYGCYLDDILECKVKHIASWS